MHFEPTGRYTCAELHHPDGSITYQICDPEGNVLADLTNYTQVETLLQHLNCFINRITTVH